MDSPINKRGEEHTRSISNNRQQYDTNELLADLPSIGKPIDGINKPFSRDGDKDSHNDQKSNSSPEIHLKLFHGLFLSRTSMAFQIMRFAVSCVVASDSPTDCSDNRI